MKRKDRQPAQPAASGDSPPRGSQVRELAAVALGGLAVAALAEALLVAAFATGAAWYRFFDASDLIAYFGVARRCAAGHRPYVDFPFEYPPLAATIFTLPTASAGPQAYALQFAGWMFGMTALAGAAIAAAARLSWPSRRRAWWTVTAVYAAAFLATGAIVANRFDAAVALVFGVVLLASSLRWPAVACLALGLGFAVKLTPVLLLPVVLLSVRGIGPISRCLAGFLAGALVPFLSHLPDGARGLGDMFHYHASRPLQIESVLATPLLIGKLLGKTEVGAGSAFGSQFIAGPGAELAATLSPLLAVSGLLLVLFLTWRRRDSLQDASALAFAGLCVLLVAMSAGKVLSPQYFVWLMPLAAMIAVEHPAIAAGLVGTALLTQVEFPALYWRFVQFERGPVALVVARNLALVTTTVCSVVALNRRRDTTDRAPSA